MMHIHDDAQDLVITGDPVQYFHQDFHNPDYSERLHFASIITVVLCLIHVIYQILLRLDFDLLPLPELLWNCLVYMMPGLALHEIERWQASLRGEDFAPRPILRTSAAKSEAMRRILGLDTTGGVIASVASAGRRRLSQLSGIDMSPTEDEARPAGLGNWDNSCYQNSVLQGLASLDPLPDYLTNSLPDDSAEEGVMVPETSMTEALKRLIGDLKYPGGKRTIWTPATLKNMSSWQQQDAQEYYSKVLDEIDKEIGNVAKARRKSRGLEFVESSSVEEEPEILSTKTYRNPLEGLIAQRVGCMTCGYSEGLSMTAFNCLTVSMNKAWGQDIRDCLDDYTRLEHIPGVECGKCSLLKNKILLSKLMERKLDDKTTRESKARLAIVEKALEDDDYDDKTLQRCKITPKSRVSSTKSKQAVIARPPRSLVIHLNRSVFNERTGELQKNTSHVNFPKRLDLGPWCLGSGGAKISSVAEEWQLDPAKPMIASSIRPSRVRGPIYELRAVVTHYGRHENGHYICYRKHPVAESNLSSHSSDDSSDKSSGDYSGHSSDEDVGQREQWWRLSDDNVDQVSEEHVLSQGGVFMLFYDCVEQPAPITPSDDSLGSFVLAEPPAVTLDDIEQPREETHPRPKLSFDSALPNMEDFAAPDRINLPNFNVSDHSDDDASEPAVKVETPVTTPEDGTEQSEQEAGDTPNPWLDSTLSETEEPPAAATINSPSLNDGDQSDDDANRHEGNITPAPEASELDDTKIPSSNQNALLDTGALPDTENPSAAATADPPSLGDSDHSDGDIDGLGDSIVPEVDDDDQIPSSTQDLDNDPNRPEASTTPGPSASEVDDDQLPSSIRNLANDPNSPDPITTPPPSSSSFDEDDDEIPSSPQNNKSSTISPYKPSQPVVISPYLQQTGGSKSPKDGKALGESTGNLLMV